MPVYDSVLNIIGKTPLVKINTISEGCFANLFAKLEYFNPAFSVKDRIALTMIEKGEQQGLITKETTIIEATSGNTGIGLAVICAVKGYRLILTMPESMSNERKKLLKTLGAQLELTPAKDGMKGAVEKAWEIKQNTPHSFMPLQFENPANPETHSLTTAQEIWNDTEGKVDIFIAGVGTGGTITGVAKTLKNKKPDIKIIAVEPSDSPVLSGGKAGRHSIQGIGAGFIPKILETNLIDEIITVSNTEAIETARLMMKKEGILCGISSGAAAFAALKTAKNSENKGKNIVFIVCDHAERYISTELFDL